jgi:hypothetical protein
MMLSTSATYTSGAVAVDTEASCHADAVSAALTDNRRLAVRTRVVFTSPRGLHDVLERPPPYLGVLPGAMQIRYRFAAKR